ncbi:hypothetical protein Prudu_241S000200 [Prunus dulcis]|uniref:Uncharacterized protein n=1 Tax=Prunus dulcis TaxID=3755 RepID=A0A5H2Y467_PRUDU|nr:hypothetical protein Prudu_241S000200 [Prunus dulcis]
MHSLEPSRPADFRERFLPTQTTVSGNTGPKRTTSLPSISPAPSQPPSATVVAGNFHGTGRASGARQDYKRHLRRIEAILVPNEPPHFPLSALPFSASIRYCSSRKLPRNRPGPTVFLKICGSSFSFVSQPNRSSKASGARQHEEASGSKGDSAEFSAEV